MKKHYCRTLLLLLVVLLAAPLASAQESIPPPVGTGGTVSRLQEEKVYPRVDTSLEVTMPYHFSFKDDLESERMINAWIAENIKDQENFYINIRGNLVIVSNETYEKDVDEVGLIFDLKMRKALRLSDFFYDGIDYMAYINGYIAEHMEEMLEYSFYNEYFGEWFPPLLLTTTGGTVEVTVYENLCEVLLKRPFTGYTPDFELFAISPPYLYILFDRNDPFFLDDLPGWGEPNLRIPLTRAVSPFGDVHYQFTLQHEPDIAFDIVMPVLSADDPDAQPAITRINEAIRPMFQDILHKAKQIFKVEPVDRQSYSLVVDTVAYTRNGKAGFAFFHDDGQEAGPSLGASSYVVRGMIFSLDTGEPIDLNALLDEYRTRSTTAYYLGDDTNDFVSQEPLKNYTLPEGSIATDVWTYYVWSNGAHDCFVALRVVTPDGETIRMVFSAPQGF